jgi:GDP-L-fucose synthase
MKIIVLGATGFVGKAVIESVAMRVLRDEGAFVYHASRTTGQDLMDRDRFSDYLSRIQPDVIINCAADIGSVHYVSDKAADVINNNTQMTLNLYESVRNSCPHAKIINPLGNCAYPGGSDIQLEERLLDGGVHDSVFSYGSFKRYLYVIAECYRRQYGIKSINFIVPNSFGEGDSVDPNKTHALNGMIIRMVKAHRDGQKTFVVWGTGKPIREWVYIRDLAEVLVRGVMLGDDIPELINIAQGKGYSISQSASAIAEAIGYKGDIVFDIDYQDGAPVKIMDDKVFKSVFPSFEFSDHKDGIRNTVYYYNNIL